MTETVPQSPFSPQRVPLTSDDPTTLPEVYERLARDHPKPNTLNYKRDGEWHSISAAKMLQRAKHIALGLYSLGIGKGERVALLSESCAEWVLTDQGCLFAGAITVPIYPTLTPPQAQYILKDSGARVLFVQSREKLAQMEEVLRDSPEISHVVLFEENAAGRANTSSLSDLENKGRDLDQQKPSLIEELARAAKPEDLATIIYTSGTTGEPKGVMLSHSNMVSNLIDSSNHFEFGEEDTALSVLPLSHVFERQAMNMYLHHGMSVYFGQLDNLGDYLREVHPTVFVGVPRIYEKIVARVQDKAASKGKLNGAMAQWAIGVGREWAQHNSDRKPIPFPLSLKHKLADAVLFKKLRNAMGGRIRILVSGGAALSNDIALAFLGAGLPIVQGYGLTETSPVITAGQLQYIRVGTSGKPIRNVEVRIAAGWRDRNARAARDAGLLAQTRRNARGHDRRRLVQNRRHWLPRRGRLSDDYRSEERAAENFRWEVHRAASYRAVDQRLAVCEPGSRHWRRAQVCFGADSSGLGSTGCLREAQRPRSAHARRFLPQPAHH